jgi:hypothetical protein
MLMLWRSGLDADGLQAMTRIMQRSHDADGRNVVTIADLAIAGGDAPRDILIARLAADQSSEERLRYGSAIVDGYLYTFHDNWKEEMSSWLIQTIAGDLCDTVIEAPPPGTEPGEILHVERLIFKLLTTRGRHPDSDEWALQLIRKMPKGHSYYRYALAVAVILDPQLLDRFPELEKSAMYGEAIDIIQGIGTTELTRRLSASRKTGSRAKRRSSPWLDTLSEPLKEEIRNLLQICIGKGPRGSNDRKTTVYGNQEFDELPRGP